MQQQNTIAIAPNGNINIQDADIGDFTLHTGNPEAVTQQLQLLNNTQIDTLLQVIGNENHPLSELFRNLLHDVAKEKNVVYGSISNVQTVRIGDEIHYHYHAKAKLSKELTLSIPKTHPDDLIGREADLAELHALLCNEKKLVVLNGLGGIGKTTVAQAYVSKYYEEYHHVAWITQGSGSISKDFIIAGGLLQNLEVETAHVKQEQLFEEIIRKLKGISERPNLLIIDNAQQSLYQFRHLLPGQPQWHLLATSREEIDGFHSKTIDFLNEKAAINLFKKYYTLQRLATEEIKALVETVDYHTLTIELLAKTARLHHYDAATLKTAVENNLRANIMVAHNGQADKIERIGEYLSAVFSLSRLSGSEIRLMKQLACLPAAFHTYDLLYELIAVDPEPENDRFAETLAAITQKGLLLYHPDTDSYKMHRIIAGVVKKDFAITIADVMNIFGAIVQKLWIDNHTDNPVDKFVWIPFGEALLLHFSNQVAPEIALLQNNLAIVLQAHGDYIGARAIYEKVIPASEELFGTDDPQTAMSYSNLALVLQQLGELERAKMLLEKTIRSHEKSFGTNDPKTAIAYSNLAIVLRDLGDYKGAKKLLKKAIRSNEKNFGAHHPDTANRYANLAPILSDLGDHAGARMLLEKAISIKKNIFGNDHPNTAIDYSNLAAVYHYLGDEKQAVQLYQKAISIEEKHFGTTHPVTAVDYTNLANLLRQQEDYAGTKALLEKVVVSNEKTFGKYHIQTITTYDRLAMVLQILGDYSGSVPLLEAVVSFKEKTLGENDPNTAVSYCNLAIALEKLGSYQQAMERLQKALNIFTPLHHPYTEKAQSIYQSLKKKSV